MVTPPRKRSRPCFTPPYDDNCYVRFKNAYYRHIAFRNLRDLIKKRAYDYKIASDQIEKIEIYNKFIEIINREFVMYYKIASECTTVDKQERNGALIRLNNIHDYINQNLMFWFELGGASLKPVPDLYYFLNKTYGN